MAGIWRRNPPSLTVRFWLKVEKTATCWLWLGDLGENGYGRFWQGANSTPKYAMAHRWSYELHVGPIADGLVIDHLCRVRHCVNPEHLEPVTHAENLLRGVGASAINARKTHCKNGHEFTPQNSRITAQGHKACRACSAASSRRRYASRKATANV